MSAQSSVDPFTSVRAKAEQYYQAGLAAEQKGDWRKALDDLRQASTWDHDGRQDIANALSRAQAQVDWQPARQSGAAPTAQSQSSSSSSAAGATSTASGTPPVNTASNTATGPTKHVDSTNFPYTISVPRDWEVKPGGTVQQPADTFLAASGTTSSALVLITVEPANSGITLDEFYVATSKSLQAEGIHNVQIFNRRQVAGQPAYVLSYRDTTDSGMVSVRHAIFVTPGKAWHVILLAAPTVTAALDQTFNAMLDSFEFKGSAFPMQ